MVLLHLSDLHFGTEVPGVRDALCKFARRLAPDVVVLTGDITQRARTRQFRAAEQFVRDLGVARTVAVPGNHDIPLYNVFGRFAAPYHNYCAAFGSQLEPIYASEHVLLVCVNTTRWYRHKNGEVSREQIQRVAEHLRGAAPQQIRIVAMHHPVVAIRMKDEANLLRHGTEAVSVWADAGVDLILGGHIHLPYVRPIHQNINGFHRRVWTVQAGTGVSWRTRDGIPNSVNVIRGGASAAPLRCCVERWDYLASTGEFQQIEMDVLYLDEVRTVS